jgi:asparagine synthase (glutamine-hydrolysing)
MCGIAGLMHQTGQPVDRTVLRAMTDVLAHRGPDGDGFHVDGPVGLGHRRLAIIDLASGTQPMGAADGLTWITYNGELYNYRELRRELEARGLTFRTTSDTEVVLNAYLAWGVECLPRLRGMFAFGIWDRSRRRLFLARDRVGIKPLVYAWDGRTLSFASELKAIVADPRVPRDLDREALVTYFVHHYVPAPATIFQAIKKLPPASYLLCSLDGGAPEVRRYWDLRLVPDHRVTEPEWVDGLTARIDEAVRLHLVSDVPIGAFLSGGIDSSAVVASMARASTGPVKTFSIGFDQPEFDELDYARQVARRYGTEHVEMVVKPEVMAILPQLAWQLDEPFADSSAVPTYCVSKITREHVTVALSGDGGDENFAGYRRYADALALSRRMDRGALRFVRPLLGPLSEAMPSGVRGRGALELLGSEPIDRYYRMMTYERDHTLAALLSPDALGGRRVRTEPAAFRRLAAEANAGDYVSTLQYVDVRHYLPGDILAKVDWTSMLTSLETRVPLLDHVLMEYVATMPVTMKLRDGAGKHVLKLAMADRLPPAVLERPKMGFGVPLGRWFRGELRDFATELLTEPRSRQRGIVRPAEVDRLLATHAAGRRDGSARIWALICFELWCRNWWDR